MTESEIITLMLQSLDASFTTVTLYLSVISGYLIVAYLAGGSLTKSQVSLVNILFVVFSLFFAYATLMNFFLADMFSTNWADTTGNTFVEETSDFDLGFIITFALILVVGILASLKFMWDVRHPKKK